MAVTKCPQCKGRAIGFSTWAKGINAFRYECESCGAALKANKWTYIFFALTLGFIGYLIVNQDSLPFDQIAPGYELGRKAKVLVMVATSIPLIVAGFFLGGYDSKDGP